MMEKRVRKKKIERKKSPRMTLEKVRRK